MTDPTSKSNPTGGGKTATQVVDAGPLAPVEEKVLRMLKGAPGPADMPLQRIGQDRPEIAAQLREIELRALKMSGRLDELRKEAGVEPVEADTETKNKIIDRLKNKD